MKESSSYSVRWSLAMLVAVALGAQAATITYVGTLTNSSEVTAWRTPAEPKSLDMDGDNKYGTFAAVHWVVAGNYSASTISYAGSGSQYRNPDYPLIDDLAQDNGTDSLASIALSQHTFNVHSNLTGKTLRVGVMWDVLSLAESASDTFKAFRLVQTIGGSATSTTQSMPPGNGEPDMVFFDIADAQAGDQYRIEALRDVGGTSGLAAYLGPVSWDVATTAETAPFVIIQPVGGMFPEGTTLNLSVVAGGTQPLAYQWLKDNEEISNATNATFSISALALADGGNYTVRISNDVDSVTSDPATVIVVSEPPAITRQPEGGLFLEGSYLTLRVSAEGSLPFSYQWLKDGVEMLGATEATLSFPGLTAANEGTYTVRVTNSAGSATSDPAVVTLTSDLPTELLNYIAAVEQDLSVFAWYPFDFLTAEDLTTAYNGTPTGQTAFGTGVGGGADKALILDGSGHVNIGTNAAFEFVDGTGTIEAWVRADWDTNAPPAYNPALFAARNVDSATTRWSLHMNTLKTQLAFWNGSAVSWVPIIYADTDWHHYAAVFENDGWRVYWDGQLMAVNPVPLGTATSLPTQLGSVWEGSTSEGWIGALDEVVFFSDPLSSESIAAHYAAFAAGDPPVIVTHPQGGEFLAGSTATLSVVATGPSLAYQWYQDGAPVPDATSQVLTLVDITEADAGIYTVTVSNETAVVTSEEAVVVVLVPNMAAYQAVVGGEAGLISYYTFDAGTADDVISINHGTLAGAAGFGTGAGNGADQALLLTGGHVTFGQVDAFDFTDGDGTIEAWLRADWDPSSPPPYNPAIIADRDGAPTYYSIHMLQAKNQLAFWNGGAVSLVPIPFAGTAWHHVAIVFEASTWTVVWDGQSLGTLPLPFGGDPSLPTQLGSSSPAGGEQWLGALDEVAIYSWALNPGIVNKHYQALTSAVLSFERAGNQFLISWARSGYKLQENSDLGNPQGWTDVAGGDQSPVTATIGPQNKFFRLIRIP